MRADRAEAEWWARLSGRPPDRKSKFHRLQRFDSMWDISWVCPRLQLFRPLPPPALSSLLSLRSRLHLKNQFQLDRDPEWKAGHSIDQASGVFIPSKNVFEKNRRSVRNLRVIANVSRSSHRHTKADNSLHSIERAEILARHRKRIHRREARCISARFDIEFRSHASHEFRHPALGGKHPGQEEQVASLHSFRVGPEWLGRGRKSELQHFQALFGRYR